MLVWEKSFVWNRTSFSAVRPVEQNSGGLETMSGLTRSADSTENLNLRGDQFVEEKRANISYYHLWALSFATTAGGHFLRWNLGLTAGFGSYIIAIGLIGTAYACLLLCLAELSSALPFAGGAYGLARVTLGVYPGFIIACAESFKSIIYVASCAFWIAKMVTVATEGDESMEPVYWLVFYVVTVAIQSVGGRWLWRCITFLSITSLVMLMIYILGSIKHIDLEENAKLRIQGGSGTELYFHGGMTEFLYILPMACWFFVGTPGLNLACGELRNPKIEMPKAYVGTACSVLLTSISVYLVTCAWAPGVTFLPRRLMPMTLGYSIMFDLDPTKAVLLSLPAVFSSGFGFMFFFGQQLRAMAKSGLLNPALAYELPYFGTPIAAFSAGGVLGYSLCLLAHYRAGYRQYFFAISMLGAMLSYLSTFLSYYVYRRHFDIIERHYTGPLGLYGAAYGFAVFLLTFVALIGFQKSIVPVLAFLGALVVCTVYYYTVVQFRQQCSDEEKEVMFRAYLIKVNAAKAQRIRKGQHSPSHRLKPSPTAQPPDTMSTGAVLTAGAAGDLADIDVPVTSWSTAVPAEATGDIEMPPVKAELNQGSAAINCGSEALSLPAQ